MIYRAAIGLLLSCIVASAQIYHVRGTVRANLPAFDIEVHAETNEQSEFSKLESLEITSNGRHVQSIEFRDDDDAPAVAKLGEAVSLRDVDCDGYRDLLVQQLSNVHGDTWYLLYRYIPAERKFVLYEPFSKIPLRSVNCHTKTLSSYLNSGAAGCDYEAGTYRWINGKLELVRLESQGAENDTSVEWFVRTIETWSGKKRTSSIRRKISADDCHRSLR